MAHNFCYPYHKPIRRHLYKYDTCPVCSRSTATTTMTTASASPFPVHVRRLLLVLVFSSSFIGVTKGEEEPPTPTTWPEQFHSILVMNHSGEIQLIDLWYDWINGRNFNIIQHQLGKLLYDLEWNNGTSFYYTLDSNRECSSAQLEVGILRPNWLDGATYIGQRQVDGFLCNVWEKAEFITYYEDVVTKRPVHWVFYTGREAHVMTFEVGAVLEDAKWQVPWYCFEESGGLKTTRDNINDDIMIQQQQTVVGAVHPNIPCCDGEYTSCCKTTSNAANTTTYGNIVGRKGGLNRNVPLVIPISP